MPAETRFLKTSPIGRDLANAHWGAYDVRHQGLHPAGLMGRPDDPAPSGIGLAMWDAYRSSLRIQRPAVREGWLHRMAPGQGGAGRGRERFVELDWDDALDLVAGELRRVTAAHGNAALFGGSYGWGSAGRFHHAPGQLHRFLNMLGGYVRHVDHYSLAAGRVVMPHVVGSLDDLMAQHHSWDVLAEHTQVFVSFGGVPLKNAQVGSGGASHHHAAAGLQRMAQSGCRFINFSPVRDDLELPTEVLEWIPIRPNTDATVMLALATETVLAGRHDTAFLARHCVGFARWCDYLLGRQDGMVKDAAWAAGIADVPADRIRAVARALWGQRSLVNVAWSLQRADHGEQPYWAAVGLAAVLGQIGLPGGGFGFAYGTINNIGSPARLLPGPTLPQGHNAVEAFIPVARIADMLLHPGSPFDYNGARHAYPEIRMVYWAGGNPFHHHQDLNRLAQAWARPDTVVVHEQTWNAHARMADIVLPVTSTLERNDIGHASRDALLIAMKQFLPPVGQARDDYAIFCGLAERLGVREAFSLGRDSMQWLRVLYAQAADGMATKGVDLPPFEEFWSGGGVRLPSNDRPVVMLAEFRADPQVHALGTPSGRIELFSERIASFGYDDCPGHPAWLEPAEWLGASAASRYPLHLLSDQPHARLHSQLDHSAISQASKVAGREPLHMHPQDALRRGLQAGDVVRVFNARGACLAGVHLNPNLREGVVKLSTGAWWDPDAPGEPQSLDRHGNPNVLTRDAGASRLSQGCSAQTCLVEVQKHAGTPPAVRVFQPPTFAARHGG
jgi:biotin/methionine sulfoxide reductase